MKNPDDYLKQNVQTITAIEPQKGYRKRLNIYVNGIFTFSLDPAVVEEYGLVPGVELTPARITELSQKNELEKAYEAALLLLRFRKRSKKEMESRLSRRGFSEELVSKTIQRLEEQGLIDDKQFVRFWKESRETFRPKGKRLLTLELKRAGIAPETIQQELGDIDEAKSAYLAAQKKARAWADLSYLEFRKKLGTYLARRGFEWEVICEVVQRLWKENKGQTAALSSQTPNLTLTSDTISD
jgi:regulatory protein